MSIRRQVRVSGSAVKFSLRTAESDCGTAVFDSILSNVCRSRTTELVPTNPRARTARAGEGLSRQSEGSSPATCGMPYNGASRTPATSRLARMRLRCLRWLGVLRFQPFRTKGADRCHKAKGGMRLLSCRRREEGPSLDTVLPLAGQVVLRSGFAARRRPRVSAGFARASTAPSLQRSEQSGVSHLSLGSDTEEADV
jgi:hypothetical protein